MKIGRMIVIGGAVISVLGATFYLQGQSIVGPQSSFMYSNPEWITHGLQILVAGVAMSALGITLALKRI